LYVTASENLFV